MKFSQVIVGVDSWQAFQKRISGCTETEKGYLFEVLVKHHLLLNPNYRTLLKQVWLFSELPEKLRGKLRLPSKDVGIDIIAETFENEYWAIQCKYRGDETRAITHSELSTFGNTTFALSNKFVYALVCTNANTFSKMYKDQDRIGFCMGDVWRELTVSFFKHLKSHLAGKIVQHKPLNPYPHQKKAITNAKKHFIKNKSFRGKLIQPCGTGKSLTGYWINAALGSQSCIVAVPSLALMKQTLNVWLREAVATRKKIKWFCVCSDEAIGKNDETHLLRQDLGIPSTTDVQKITKWLKSNRNSTVILFTTYQSGKAVAQASRNARAVFDVGILDEAHKTVGNNDRAFSHLLHEKNIHIKRRIFMTATERRYVGAHDKVASMDNISIYGDTFELITYKDALKAKPTLLSDYKILTVMVNKTEISDFLTQNNWIRLTQKNWNKEIDVNMLTALIALRKAFDEYPISHAVSFHNGISRAKEFQYLQDIYNHFYPHSKTIEAFHVSGCQPVSKRSKTLEGFSTANTGLVTNARCLTEGIDIPKIDCVLFADPRRSVIDIVQAAGRALRKHRKKQYGYIIIPVLTAECDQIIDDRTFNHVLTVIRALASNDDRIIEYFKGEKGKKKYRGLLDYSASEYVSKEMSLDSIVESLELKVWKKLGKLSWRPFNEARSFVRQLKLTSFEQWNDYHTNRLTHLPLKPPDIPASPGVIYRYKGWKGWGDWLGTFNPAPGSIYYRSFEDAREFVRSLGLKNMDQWRSYAAGPGKPADIPASPVYLYGDKGWKGMGDWLGTGNIAFKLKRYRSYDEASKFTRNLGLKNVEQWRSYCKGELLHLEPRPADIPTTPRKTYKNKGWKNWNDWLGTNNISNWDKTFLPFQEAREFAHTLELKKVKEWQQYAKGLLTDLGIRPANIPSNPNETYLDDGWVDWGDWLGTGIKHHSKKSHKTYEEARAFVQTLKLRSNDEWRLYCKGVYEHLPRIPDDIPKTPNQKYKAAGWVSWGDWLGTNVISTRRTRFWSFTKARKFIRSLQLASESEWRDYYKGQLPGKQSKPAQLPAQPNQVYFDKGWTSWSNWLGIHRPSQTAIKLVPFEEARKFVQALQLKNSEEYKMYCKEALPGRPPKPRFMTTNPNRTYADQGWKGWGDWLGTGRVANFNIRYRSFSEARKFVRKLKLKSGTEWQKYCHGKLPGKGVKPADIPAKPNGTYKGKGWLSMGDWLGTNIVATYNIHYRGFEEARHFARSLKLKNGDEWSLYCKGGLIRKKRPKDIPACPSRVYKNKGWEGMGDWLGTGRLSPRNRIYRTFTEARKFVRSLGLKNYNEWKQYCTGELKNKGVKPADIPASPAYRYKGLGWVNMRDWLGASGLRTNNASYRNFSNARTFVRNLQLASSLEWKEYCAGKIHIKGKKPDDIPAYPDRVYKNKGWEGFANWLGTRTNRAPFIVTYLSYAKAKDYVNGLGLKNQREWRNYCKGEMKVKKPAYIPNKPERVYKNSGWTGLGDWLGTKTASPFPQYQPVYRQLRSYEEAKKFARKLKLKSWKEWFNYCAGKLSHPIGKPQDIPSNPQRSYKAKGWTNWGDWLGTYRLATNLWEFESFEKARRFARKLKLKNSHQWFQFCWGKVKNKPKRPANIPTNPHRTYKNKGWINWQDWLNR